MSEFWRDIRWEVYPHFLAGGVKPHWKEPKELLTEDVFGFILVYTCVFCILVCRVLTGYLLRSHRLRLWNVCDNTTEQKGNIPVLLWAVSPPSIDCLDASLPWLSPPSHGTKGTVKTILTSMTPLTVFQCKRSAHWKAAETFSSGCYERAPVVRKTAVWSNERV